MDAKIEVLAAADIDRLKPLWLQLAAHHGRRGSHLEAVAPMRSPEDTWRVRRGLYAEWLRSPLTRAFTVADGDRLLGYAMLRIAESPGSWEWGDRTGVLETLVVDDEARGSGIGKALVEAARDHLTAHSVRVMNISVLAGNDAAVRFYEREGAVEFVRTLVMPIPG